MKTRFFFTSTLVQENMIPIWVLWIFTVYRWYDLFEVAQRKTCSNLTYTLTAFFLLCHLHPTSLFSDPQENQAPASNPFAKHPFPAVFSSLSSFPLIHFHCTNHFSTIQPVPLRHSQSLLLQLDSPLRQQGHQGGWTV